MPKGGARAGAGRPATGLKRTFLIAVKPALFQSLKKTLELGAGEPVDDKQVLDLARSACYQAINQLAAKKETETEALIL